MDLATLTPRVREALGVSTSYDAETIPAAIRRAMQRLLRDYNFPKSLTRQTYPLVTGDQSFDLPEGFKKEYLLQIFNADDEKPAWGDPLTKREGFVRPQSDGSPRHYWLEGNKLWIDTPLPEVANGYQLQLFYQNWSSIVNEAWFLEDFHDVLFYFTVYRTAAEMRKPEVMQAFSPLWAEEQQSLAIFANELEFDNLYMQMREPAQVITSRYPK